MSNVQQNKDIIKFFIVKIIIGLIGLITVSLYSSFLNPDEYGDYSLINSFIKVLIAIFIGWIGSSSLRYYDEFKKNEDTFFSNVAISTSAMLILLLLVLGIFSLCSEIPINKYILFVIPLTIILSLLEIFEKILRASQKTTIYSFAILLQSILNVTLFVLLFKIVKKGIYSLFISNIVSNFLFLIIALCSLKFFKKINIKNIDLNLQNKFMKYGLAMIGVWGVSWILSYFDRYIIAYFYSNYEVGIYDMSYRISESSINIIISSFTLAIFPMLISIWNKVGKEGAEKKITEVFRYYFIVILPAVCGMIAISDKLYLGLLDEKYSMGQPVIIYTCLGMFFNGFNSILNKIWQLNEKTKNIFYIMLISVFCNIFLNIFLLPKLGIVGAAIATLISYLVSNMITYILVIREFKIVIDIKSVVKSLGSCIIMVTYLRINSININNMGDLFIKIIFAAVIYLIMNIILGNFNIEINYLVKRMRKDEKE